MPARRTIRAVVALAGLVTLIVAVAVGIRLTRPPDLEAADRITLYSIDGRGEPAERLPGTGEVLHGYPVLGKVVVTDPARKRELARALRDGLDARDVTQDKCFWPRHVLRVEYEGRVTDYVICFHCQNYELYVGGDRRNRYTESISRHVRPVFDKPLTDANVPITPE